MKPRAKVVLIAEDEEFVRKIVVALVVREGYQTLVASDGRQALEMSRSHAGEIGLLLTDVNMPNMDGISLCREVIRERPGIRILLMSGHGSDPLHGAGKRLQFLRKPFKADTVRRKIQEAIDGPPAEAGDFPERPHA
jgi:two-component system cell cycle sensor histidine kinase/response regulator CckA